MRTATFIPPVLSTLAALLASACLLAPAQAAAVDITGGFYAYSGPLVNHLTGDQVHSVFSTPDLGAVNANPSEAIPGFDFAWRQGYGQGDVALFSRAADNSPVPASTVDFYLDRTFGAVVHNSIAFTPSTGLDLQVGQTFKLGTFSFANGGWIGDLGDGVFNFSARTSSSVAALDGHVLNMRIGFHVTTGCTPDYSVCKPNDPVLNADYFYSLPSADYPGVKLDYVGVYELESGLGNTGSVDLYAKIGSLLPVALANPVNVTLQPAIPSPVPEPSMLVLMVGGLGLVLWVLRRRPASGTHV